MQSTATSNGQVVDNIDDDKLRQGLEELRRQITLMQAQERAARAKLAARTGKGATSLPIAYDAPGLPRLAKIPPGRQAGGGPNLLIEGGSLTANPTSGMITQCAERIIRKTDGLMPTWKTGRRRAGEKSELRLTATWTIPQGISGSTLVSLHALAHEVYGNRLNGCAHNGRWSKIVPRGDNGKVIPKRYGIFISPDYFDGLAHGFVGHRGFGRVADVEPLVANCPYDWISQPVISGATRMETTMELHESVNLFPDDYIYLVAQASYMFAHAATLPSRELWFTTFRELSLVNISETSQEFVGMESIYREIRRTLLNPLEHPELAAAYGHSPQSILLTGIPGTGKTRLAAEIIRTAKGFIPIHVTTDMFFSDFVKSSSAILARIKKICEKTGGIALLLVDDIEDLVKGSLTVKFMEFMNGISGGQLLILASTNKPWEIDSRLLTPQRFGRALHVGLPEEAEREAILRAHMVTMPFTTEAEKELVIRSMAKECKGWTQRYLAALCQEAAGIAEEETLERGPDAEPILLASRHFIDARMSMIKTSVNVDGLAHQDRRIQTYVAASYDWRDDHPDMYR